MVRKVCFSIITLFLLAGLGSDLSSEVAGNAPGQRDITKGKIAGKGGKKLEEGTTLAWYRERFVLWRVCHEELTAKLGENIKRDKAYIQRAMAALEELSRALPEKKKQDLQAYIDGYEKIAGDLKGVGRRGRERKLMKRSLDKLKRGIETEFSYKMVEVRSVLVERKKDIIRPGKVPHPAGALPAGGKRYRYVADRNSRTFHRVMCRYASKIREENRVYFETKKEARESGRRVHRGCR